MSLEAKKSSMELFTSSSVSKVLSRRNHWRDWMRWKSDGVRFGEYGGCGKTRRPRDSRVSLVTFAVRSAALSWRRYGFNFHEPVAGTDATTSGRRFHYLIVHKFCRYCISSYLPEQFYTRNLEHHLWGWNVSPWIGLLELCRNVWK